MATPAVQMQRRSGGGDFRIAGWLVQPRLGTLCQGEICRHLEPKSMQVLECLVAHAGSVVSKDELIYSVWNGTFVSEHVLTHAIWQLRQAFGNDAVIQTLSRRGYRLAAPVQAAAPRISHLAVLPLLNLSGDPEQEYFADGITEALTSTFAQIAAWRVTSRTSAMLYKNSRKPLPEIASALKVDAVVEGSVVRAGDHVRVVVQLIDAATDENLWAGTFDRDLRDILSLQHEIARAIVSEIQMTLTPGEHARLARHGTVNFAAYEACLKGRYFYFRISEDSLRLSVDYFRQAIAADDKYALAHAALADSASVLSLIAAMPAAEANRIMRPAILRSLELDPDLPEAHFMLGWMRLFYDWNWTGAEDALTHAISLNPSYSQGYAALADMYEVLGRGEDAVVARRQACRLDPLSVFYGTLLGGSLVLAGRPAEAVEQLCRTLELEPNYWFPHEVLGFALVDLGRLDEAISAEETAVRLSPDPVPRAALGYVYGCAGRIADARGVLDEIERMGRSRYVSPTIPAAVNLAVGEWERALERLEQGFRDRDPVMVLLRIFPFWRALRGHPRFERIAARMKLPG